jgi:hypothetical protein
MSGCDHRIEFVNIVRGLLDSKGGSMPAADPLVVAAWHYAVGDLRAEDLPDLATDALVRGLDSPSLRSLAGQNPGDVRDSRDLFLRVLSELNITSLDVESPIWQLVRFTATAIVSGDISPAEGAGWIARSAYWRAEEEGDLRIFVGLASELEDHPDYIDSIEKAIVNAATEMLHRAEPRRWMKLRAAVGGSPLTHTGASGEREIDATALPISPQLLTDLLFWNDTYNAILAGWPKARGFHSEPHAETFVDQGTHLVVRLQSELGPEHHVEYMPEPIRKPGLKLSTNQGWRSKLSTRLRGLQ